MKFHLTHHLARPRIIIIIIIVIIIIIIAKSAATSTTLLVAGHYRCKEAGARR